MLKWFRDNTTSGRGEVPSDKIVRGVLVDRELPGYVESYHKLMKTSKKRV